MYKTQLYNGLPIYEVYFEDGAEIETIALVKHPANARHFEAFSEHKARYSIIDEEQRIVFGLVMGVGQIIVRDGYYAYFSADSVKQLHERYMKSRTQAPLLVSHNENQPVQGAFMVESLTKDTERGISPKGYEDLPDGSWFAAYKVEDDEIWKGIKDATFQGFSIHGFLQLKPVDGLNVEPDLEAEFEVDLAQLEHELSLLNL